MKKENKKLTVKGIVYNKDNPEERTTYEVDVSNLYYTPEIEEFHVGFEFETNNPNIMGSLAKDWEWIKFEISRQSFCGDYDGQTELMDISFS